MDASSAREMESRGIRIEIPGLRADDLFERLISAPVPIVGVIEKDILTINFMTIFDRDIDPLVKTLSEIKLQD